MASTKEYLDFVLEQLSGLDEISSRNNDKILLGQKIKRILCGEVMLKCQRN